MVAYLFSISQYPDIRSLWREDVRCNIFSANLKDKITDIFMVRQGYYVEEQNVG